MMKKKIFAIIIICLSVLPAGAQDYILSQPWRAPITIAPSFAGINKAGRVFTTYRNQYSSVQASQTILAGYDQYFHPIRSSFGGLITYNTYAGGSLSQVSFDVQYNYLVQMSREWYFRPGLQIGVFYRMLDASRLLFIDQINLDGQIVSSTSFQAAQTSLFRFDAAVSLLFYNKYVMFGVNAGHLLGNNISFTDQPETVNPIKLTGTVVGVIPIKKGRSRYAPQDDVTIAALYQWQGQYHQIDFDVMYHRQYFMAGIGYRGIPFYSPEVGFTNNDAVKFMVGGSYAGFSLSYSYDLGLSSLMTVSGGSHEIVLSYDFAQKRDNHPSFFCY